jgi:hypothetical protein
MPNSGLFGPNPLTIGGIDSTLTGTGPGAYALGEVDNNGTFIISYVGRSDADLKERLKCHVGNYASFKYAFFPSAAAAFQKECELFHDFGETALDNHVHPARPENSQVKCPRCG